MPRIEPSHDTDFSGVEADPRADRKDRELFHQRLDQLMRKRILLDHQQLSHRLVRQHPLTGWSRTHQCVKHIYDPDDLGILMDLGLLELVGIPLCLPSLMFLPHDLGQPGIAAPQLTQDLESQLWVLLNALVVFLAQPVRIDHERLWHQEHANIMDKTSQGQMTQFLRLIPEPYSELGGQDRNINLVRDELEVSGTGERARDEAIVVLQRLDDPGGNPGQNLQSNRLVASH